MILSKPFAIACSLAALLKVSAAEESITLSAGFMEATNFAERGEDGTTWSGFLFDLADVLVDKAAADGVTLEIAIDTVNGVLSDSFSYNEALASLDPDCAGELCYDMILADYYHTAERSQIVTFPQPYSTAYITTFKMTDTGAYSSIEEANAGGGSVCIRAGTATIDSLTPITNTVIACADNADCVAKLKAGECDLWATDNQNGGGAIGDEPDISTTGEVLLDIFWLTNALKSSLEPKVLQWMNKWHYDAKVSGDISSLEQKWFGFTNDFSAAYPETMSVSAGIIEFPPFAEVGEDGSLAGYLADIAEAIKAQAETDGTTLTIDIDTANPLNDYTYNGALETVSPNCAGESCYDMILADYYHTAERSVIATFTPSFLSTYLSSFKAPDGMYNSFAEANAAGGSTCLWVGTATYDTVGADAATIVDCSDMTDCLTKLEAGECDLFVEDIRNTKLATQDTSIVCTEEIIGDTFFFANPMASNLEPNMMVLLSKWYLDAGAAGKFDELEATYFGGDGGTEGGDEEGEGDGDGGDEGEGGTSSASRSGIIVSAAVVVVATLLI